MGMESLNTKTTLILASGPIFAEKGPEGASVRTIAKAAGANVASVNYHFGTKENLYLAVYDYVIDKIHGEYLHEGWNAMSIEERKPDNIRNYIKSLISLCFENFFFKGHPDWYYTLLYKEMCSPGEAFMRLKKNVIVPEHTAAREIFEIIKPHAGPCEADVWVTTWMGQLFFTATTMNAHKIVYDVKGEELPDDYLQQVIISTTKVALALLDN